MPDLIPETVATAVQEGHANLNPCAVLRGAKFLAVWVSQPISPRGINLATLKPCYVLERPLFPL